VPKNCRPLYRTNTIVQLHMKLCGRRKRKLLVYCMEVGRRAFNYYSGGRKQSWRKYLIQWLRLSFNVKEGKLFFRRFFYAFGLYLEGFQEGCMPYLSVDSTILNGRYIYLQLQAWMDIIGCIMLPLGFFSPSRERAGLGSYSSYTRL
jgi:hypothetical protein